MKKKRTSTPRRHPRSPPPRVFAIVAVASVQSLAYNLYNEQLDGIRLRRNVYNIIIIIIKFEWAENNRFILFVFCAHAFKPVKYYLYRIIMMDIITTDLPF